MMRTLATAAATEVAVMDKKASNEDGSVERLLVNVDTSNRSELELIHSTIQKLEGNEEKVKEVILIAFKRRNHKKSQAEGEGAGEKAIFVEILVSVIQMGHGDLIQRILPLVAVYGCWKDLAVLAERVIIRGCPIPAGHAGLHPICQSICQLFAKQMLADQQNADSVPSNACKYCPHEKRHRSVQAREQAGKASKEAEERLQKALEEAAKKPFRRCKKRAFRPLPPASEDPEPKVKRVRTLSKVDEEAHQSLLASKQANQLLAKEIGRLVCQEHERYQAAAVLRKLRASLNDRLVQRGHLVEQRMCDKQLTKINFFRANHGSLSKYAKAIKKDPQAAKRWGNAMKVSSNAVPDMDSLLTAVDTMLAEADDELKIFPLQYPKAVQTMKEACEAMLIKAQAVLSAAGKTADLSVLALPFVVLDTASCEDVTQRMALVLAGLLASLSQGSSHMVIDGQLVSVEGLDGNTWKNLCPASAASIEGSVERLEASLTMALSAKAAAFTDVLLICRTFSAYTMDSDAVHALLASAQAGAPALRTLRIHRMQHRVQVGAEAVPFRSRARAGALDISKTSADLLFVVDFTGSMGSYMSAVKTELLGLINELQTSTQLRQIRVGLVGYRDYRDAGRVVIEPFRVQSDLQELLKTIRNQHPSGGNDAPEDMLSGLKAAGDLQWASDLRMMVIVADANAHGYEGCGDNHPNGKCPDQVDGPDLPQAMAKLADQLAVDTFFCQLNNGTAKTQQALQQVYEERCGGRGFGTISMEQGAASFRAQVLASLSAAVLSTVAEKDISGLQTADGVSVSSVTCSLLASLRESLTAVGEQMEEVELETEADGDYEDEGVEKEEEEDYVGAVTREEVEEEDDGEAAEEEEDDEERDGEMEESEVVGPPKGSAWAAKVRKVADTDWQRLQRELQLEELQPVRMALSMPLATHLLTLSQKACQALFRAGLTAEELVANGYPEPILDAYRTFLAESLSHI